MINVLPQHVINKIAAGEVVERPANVVKELVENSIDAGAKNISISVEGNAIGLIEVVDDGCGMDERDAMLCIKHHATSKIMDIGDLLSLRSLGFRGEALSSIAAVSIMTITTKTSEMDEGVCICIESGNVISKSPAAMKNGTRVRIEKLFFNVPARLKFLRSVRTEEALISETIRNIALAYPEIAFQYKKEGKEVFNFQSGDEKIRIQQSMSGLTLYPVLAEGSGILLRAYLSAPFDSRRGAGELILIVNRRWVQDKGIVAAISSAYEGLLEKGFYPRGVVFIDVPPSEVDVNVHPQKREIRFANYSAVIGFVRKKVNEAIQKTPWALPSDVSSVAHSGDLERYPEKVAEKNAEYVPAGRARIQASCQTDIETFSKPEFYQAYLPICANAKKDFQSSVSLHGEEIKYIGQLFLTYLLCEKGDRLVIIDQHAAAERIKFEQLRRDFKARKIIRQPLLFPAVIEVKQKEVAVIEENEGLIESVGIDASISGETTVMVRALPEILGNVDPKPLIEEIAGILLEGEGKTEDIIDAMLALMACHGSVRAGKILTQEEALDILKQLENVDFSTHCPHGRPIQLTIHKKEIESKLGR